jgi:hypothetical protein
MAALLQRQGFGLLHGAGLETKTCHQPVTPHQCQPSRVLQWKKPSSCAAAQPFANSVWYAAKR